ncbi:MAG: hypothetical protein DDT19_02256 [Syntrophomonadaceae bacterium]|nr:hypothetical protein [Bacillota bacterium]
MDADLVRRGQRGGHGTGLGVGAVVEDALGHANQPGQVVDVQLHGRRPAPAPDRGGPIDLSVDQEDVDVPRPGRAGGEHLDVRARGAGLEQRAARREVAREVVVAPVRQERPAGRGVDQGEVRSLDVGEGELEDPLDPAEHREAEERGAPGRAEALVRAPGRIATAG